jgi:hypothetical protein
MYRAPAGELTAPDGWMLCWDLRIAASQEIVSYDADGVRQDVLSGDIDSETLEREIAAFMSSHTAQLALW